MRDCRRLFFVVLVLPLSAHATLGQDRFLDDFRDGDLFDGRPVQWRGMWGGSVIAGEGRLRLYGSGIPLARAESVDPHAGWSIQTRVFLEGPAEYIGPGILADNGGSVSLALTPDQRLVLAADGQILDEAIADAVQEDALLRLDAFDDMLRAWAWDPREEMPEEPLLVVETGIPSGRPALAVDPKGGGETSASISFFEAATSPLPDLIYGDFNFDRIVDVADIDLLSSFVNAGQFDPDLDITYDGILDAADRESWVFLVARTRFGDANLDGMFNQLDLVQVLQAGEYMDGVEGNSTWATGDWNGDGEFDRFDLVTALQDGGYEQGPRLFAVSGSPAAIATQTVPEPSAIVMLLLGLLGVVCTRSLRRRVQCHAFGEEKVSVLIAAKRRIRVALACNSASRRRIARLPRYRRIVVRRDYFIGRHIMKSLERFLLVASTVLINGQATFGQAYYFDDFRDGNLRDGVPINWQSRWGASVVPDEGRLRISGSDSSLALAESIDSQPGWSLLTRASLEGAGLYVGVGVLFDAGGNVWLGLQPRGNLAVGTPGVTLAEATTEAFADDVMLRLDAFDNVLEAWAWDPQEDMPAEPLVVTETAIGRGVPGVWVGAGAGQATARFSFVEAATSPLPDLVYGDFNFDRVLDESDIDLLSSVIRSGQFDLELDITRDGILDGLDREHWVFWAMRTRFGDGNLDGMFDQLDLVEALQAGEYMDDITGNSIWATGDWNGDGEFDRFDLVTVLQDGGYEQGPRLFAFSGSPAAIATQTVPEPSAIVMLLLGLSGVACTSSLRRRRRR